MYIYALCDPDTGTVRYVGKANDPQQRLATHLKPSKLKYRTHKNSWLRGLIAQGKLPVLRILEQVTARTWQEAECDWIARYTAEGAHLTNTAPGGSGGIAQETREKLRQALTGRKRGPVPEYVGQKIAAKLRGLTRTLQARARISAALQGHVIPQATRDKIGQARRGHTHTVEARARIGLAKRGNRYRTGKHSTETCQRISEAMKGRAFTDEHRRKLSEAAMQRKASPETRQRMSEAMKQYHARRRQERGEQC